MEQFTTYIMSVLKITDKLKIILNHHPLVPHICVNEWCQHWLKWWPVACSAPSHYLNQCWFIVNWTLRNKLQRNSNQNTKLSTHGNGYKNIVSEMAAICPRGDELSWVLSNMQYYVMIPFDLFTCLVSCILFSDWIVPYTGLMLTHTYHSYANQFPWTLGISRSFPPFYWHGLTLISALMRNHRSSNVRDEITCPCCPFPNFNGCPVDAWE